MDDYIDSFYAKRGLEAELKRMIDEALDNRDKEKFMLLSSILKETGVEVCISR